MSQDIRDTIYKLWYEFKAEGAWYGHADGFEYMHDYYTVLGDYMTANQMDVTKMNEAYRNAVNEYDAIVSDDSRSFLHAEDSQRLEQLDRQFLNELAYSAQEVADKLNIKDIQFVGDIVPEDLHMPDADSTEFGPSVLKDKFVRTGSSVEKESSRLQGRNGDDVANVIARDMRSEFSGFFGKTSGTGIDEFVDGTYDDETGGTLTIQWGADRKSAVCCKETILATGMRQVTEIAYNPSQLELAHEYPDFDDDRLQSASSVESETTLQVERPKKVQRRLPIPDIGIEEFEPEKESTEIEF